LPGRLTLVLPLSVALLGGCSNSIIGDDPDSAAGNKPGNGGASGNSGTGGASGNSGASGAGNSSGAAGTSGVGGTGLVGGGGPTPQCADQAAITPGQAPLRRLTIPEYNHTVRDIIGETSNPAFTFPSELSGNGFGNDALSQPVSSTLATAHNTAAEAIAARVTAPAAIATLLPCATGVTATNREACARTFIDSFVPKAYRRPLVAGEADELVTMFNEVLAIADDDPMSTVATQFASGIAAIIEAVLVSPDFLYKPEFGQPDAANPAVKRPTGMEMATRLSYLYLASSPDAELLRAAQAGELATNDGVRTQAMRLVNLPQAREVVRYFFDALLPLGHLTDLPRDTMLYPTFNSTIGSLMAQETRTFLEREVFEADGSGTWAGILTAPYSYMNGTLATYYGMQGAVTGDAFQRVTLDPAQRRGLITQGAILTGLTPSNHTNPVIRGGFIVNLLMCRNIGLPSDPAILAMVTPPDPGSAPTGRQRFTNHSQLEVCAGCHVQMDPVGFALENYDAVGLWRTMENGVVIDASGEVPDMPGGDFGDCPSGIACGEKASGTKYQTPCNGSCATELAERLGRNAEIMTCFPTKWLDFAYGQTLTAADPHDVCNRENLAGTFINSGSNIKQMLIDISQTDGFLYLGAQ
jgi:hypothetical protein